jgi:WD40 repeat protein
MTNYCESWHGMRRNVMLFWLPSRGGESSIRWALFCSSVFLTLSHTWLDSLEIARRRFRKFNSKYIESIKIVRQTFHTGSHILGDFPPFFCETSLKAMLTRPDLHCINCFLVVQVKLWNLSRKECIRSYSAHSGFVRGLAVVPTGEIFISVSIY